MMRYPAVRAMPTEHNPGIWRAAWQVGSMRPYEFSKPGLHGGEEGDSLPSLAQELPEDEDPGKGLGCLQNRGSRQSLYKSVLL